MEPIKTMQAKSAQEVRQMIRDGLLRAPTSGYADGYMQANLMILPAEYAADFKGFCDKNPKSCPLVAMGKPGDPSLPLAGNIDIRTDVARYRVYREGVHIDTVDNLLDKTYYEKVSGISRQNFYGEPRRVTVALKARY